MSFTVSGTVVRGHENGNGTLFATNQSSNVSVLRTVNGFGISTLAEGGYFCFANNSFNTATINITVNIAGRYCIQAIAIYIMYFS